MATFNEKMTAIADAIRAKTGGEEPLTLDGIAAGVDEVYAAGVEEGKTSSSAGWKLFKRINLIDYCELYEGDEIDINGNIYRAHEFSNYGDGIELWEAEDTRRILKVVLGTPDDVPYMAEGDDIDVDIFVVWESYYLFTGDVYNGTDGNYTGTHYVTYFSSSSEEFRVVPLYCQNDNYLPGIMTPAIIVYIKQNVDGTYTLPKECFVDIYELEGVEI